MGDEGGGGGGDLDAKREWSEGVLDLQDLESLCQGEPAPPDLHSDSWNLSHLGYLYPGTTPVMIKLDYNRSCPWV